MAKTLQEKWVACRCQHPNPTPRIPVFGQGLRPRTAPGSFSLPGLRLGRGPRGQMWDPAALTTPHGEGLGFILTGSLGIPQGGARGLALGEA